MSFEVFFAKFFGASWRYILSISIASIAFGLLDGIERQGKPIHSAILLGGCGLVYLIVFGISTLIEKKAHRHTKAKEKVEERIAARQEVHETVAIQRSDLEERLNNLSPAEKELLGVLVRLRRNSVTFRRTGTVLEEAVISLKVDKLLTAPYTSSAQVIIEVKPEAMAYLFKNEHLVSPSSQLDNEVIKQNQQGRTRRTSSFW